MPATLLADGRVQLAGFRQCNQRFNGEPGLLVDNELSGGVRTKRCDVVPKVIVVV